MPERWAAIPGYEGIYEVSDHGRVRRLVQRYYRCLRALPEPVMITPKRRGHDYLAVDLARDGEKRSTYIHVLVAGAFLGPKPSPLHEVAHGDGDGEHNVFTNLGWKTRSGNHLDKRRHSTMPRGERHANAKLSEAAVREILVAAGPHEAVAVAHGVSRSLVSQIKRREVWAHVA